MLCMRFASLSLRIDMLILSFLVTLLQSLMISRYLSAGPAVPYGTVCGGVVCLCFVVSVVLCFRFVVDGVIEFRWRKLCAAVF